MPGPQMDVGLSIATYGCNEFYFPNSKLATHSCFYALIHVSSIT
jgi:hypothetical protein